MNGSRDVREHGGEGTNPAPQRSAGWDASPSTESTQEFIRKRQSETFDPTRYLPPTATEGHNHDGQHNYNRQRQPPSAQHARQAQQRVPPEIRGGDGSHLHNTVRPRQGREEPGNSSQTAVRKSPASVGRDMPIRMEHFMQEQIGQMKQAMLRLAAQVESVSAHTLVGVQGGAVRRAAQPTRQRP